MTDKEKIDHITVAIEQLISAGVAQLELNTVMKQLLDLNNKEVNQLRERISELENRVLSLEEVTDP